jgi:hypothetical protein
LPCVKATGILEYVFIEYAMCSTLQIPCGAEGASAPK